MEREEISFTVLARRFIRFRRKTNKRFDTVTKNIENLKARDKVQTERLKYIEERLKILELKK